MRCATQKDFGYEAMKVPENPDTHTKQDLRINPPNKTHHPTKAIPFNDLGTGGGSPRLFFLQISLLLLPRDGVCDRVWVFWQVKVVIESFCVPYSHVHDVIWGKAPHDELPCRRCDTRNARLSSCVKRDTVTSNAPQFRVCMLREVDSLLSDGQSPSAEQ